MRLAGKVALITGGTSGIGRATALLFAREGARVAITGRDEVRGRVVLHDIKGAGSEGIFVRADVRSADDCRRAVDETLKAFKKIDVLFNNAGVFFPHTVPDCTEDEWDQTIDVNLKGTYLMSRCVLPHMIAQRAGAIVNNSSGWGLAGGDAAAAYCASKGGVVLLTKAMAIDHGRQGIRVNSVAPGWIYTDMSTSDLPPRGTPVENLGALKRAGEPEEVAAAIVFLASNACDFMTGTTLFVDGGQTIIAPKMRW